ncbi:MAG: TlpA family protein disulfide reductase [Chitinophagales bacterium]
MKYFQQQATRIISKYFVVVLLFSVLLLGNSSCGEQGRLVNGATVPNIELEDKDGNLLSLEEIGKNKIVVIDFWASWCKPCIETHKALKEVYEEYSDLQIGNADGLVIYSVSLDDKATDWKRALEKHNIPWYNVHDPAGFKSEYVDKFQFETIPQVYVIDERGIIIAKNITLKWLQYELNRRMGKV